MPIATVESAKNRCSEAPRVGKAERHGNLNCNECERGTALREGSLSIGHRQRWSCERSGGSGRCCGADGVGFWATLQRYGARGWRRRWSCGARAVRRRRRDGNIRAPCVIRGVCAAKRAPPWQDLRAVHSRKALCRAFRIHGAHILPKPARFGCTAAICCQGGALFPSGALSGMHEAKKLPRQGVRERIARKYCHGRPPGNAPRRNIAAGGRWGTQRTGAGWCGVRRNRACRCRQIPLARQGASAGGAKQLSGVAVGMVLSGRGRGWTEKKGATRRSAAALSPPQDKRRRAFCSPSFAV